MAEGDDSEHHLVGSAGFDEVIERFAASWNGQQNIHVDVDYYDEAERRKLEAFSSAPAVAAIVQGGVDIPVSEFLTYYLFHQKRPGKDGFSTYADLRRQIPRALAELAGWVEHNGTSICAAAGAVPFQRAISERLGEGVGLSVIGRVHRLTEADWDKIPERPGRGGVPTFDYQIASDGVGLVQVETKGTCIDFNSQERSGVIAGHKANLARKKARIAEVTATIGYPFAAALRYGAIVSLDRNPHGVARCLLTDPPGDVFERRPRDIRLISRMKFIRDLVRFVAQRSQLASALATRVADLEASPDPRVLDGVPLLRGDGRPFSFDTVPGFNRWHSSFMASRSRVADGPAGGAVVQISPGALFFFGFQEMLLVHAAEQNFDRILSVEFPAATVEKTIVCLFSRRDFGRLDLPAEVRERAVERGGRLELRVSGAIQYSRGGIVFGVLPLKGQDEPSRSSETDYWPRKTSSYW